MLRRVLVDYDGHTIYQVYIKDKKKVIKAKDICIFKDYKIKIFIGLPDYNDKLIFQSFLSKNNDKRSKELSNTYTKRQKIISTKRKQISEIDAYIG